MKFRCERDMLVDAIANCGRASASRSTSAVLGGVKLTCGGNRLDLVGTDLDLTIRSAIEVIGIDDGSCVLPSRLGADVVRSLDPGAVTVESSEGQVEISASRARFVVNTFPVEDFPVMGEVVAHQVRLGHDDLLDALRQVVRAASGDDARPLLTGVLMERTESGVRLVATDSYRLALRNLPGVQALPEGIERIIVPARCLAELQRALGSGGKDAGSEVGIGVADLEVSFEVGGMHIGARLLDGKFPDYEQLIPTGYPSQLVVGRESMLEALRRVRLLVRDNTTAVRLSITTGTVELSVSSHEIGHMTEQVDADLEGDEATVSFNPAYLVDGIEAIEEDEVEIQITDTSKPSTVRAPGDSEYRYLLMPVRVS